MALVGSLKDSLVDPPGTHWCTDLPEKRYYVNGVRVPAPSQDAEVPAPELVRAIDKLRADLAWTGPTGKVQKLCVLDRAMAQAIVTCWDADVKRP